MWYLGVVGRHGRFRFNNNHAQQIANEMQVIIGGITAAYLVDYLEQF